MRKYLILTLISLMLSIELMAQSRIDAIAQRLEDLALDNPKLNETVEFSVNGASIQEVLRAIGLSHNVNLSIDPGITDRITNNFSDARIVDVIVYLCKEYSLEISVTGNIINLKKYQLKPEIPKPLPPKVLLIEYDEVGDVLSLDLKNDTIEVVAKEITKRSGKNIIISPESANKLVSIYLQKVPFENAADKLAYSTGLQLSKTKDGVYILEKQETLAATDKGSNQIHNRGRGLKGDQEISVQINPGGLLTVYANNVGISKLLETVAKDAGVHYLLYSIPKGETSLFVENLTFSDFLDRILTGSNLTYKLKDSIYLIGERNFEGLRHTELVRLENRTIQQVKEAIPLELKKEVELFEFKELNGIVLSGSKPKIDELKLFIRQIDQIVPLVTIDVMIVDINSSRSTETGLTFGLGKTQASTTGSTNGGIDMSLSSKSINQLISAFNGFGSINLGKVTPNFYLNLKALESEGIIKTRSTPKLSTLNGNEASLSIGETTYYLEVTNNLSGTLNPTITSGQNYKSVNADLTVTINPVVSGDEQVTLSIEVNQSDFTGKKISSTAPPGTVTRKFKSIIRVKNEEMIILGGLENNKIERSGSGLPLINRIPIIKYLLGNRLSNKSKSKLTIFIKPTIQY